MRGTPKKKVSILGPRCGPPAEDDEELIGRIVLVSEDEGDVIYDLLATNRESNYEKFDEKPGGYVTPFSEIKHVEALDE